MIRILIFVITATLLMSSCGRWRYHARQQRKVNYQPMEYQDEKAEKKIKSIDKQK